LEVRPVATNKTKKVGIDDAGAAHHPSPEQIRSFVKDENAKALDESKATVEQAKHKKYYADEGGIYRMRTVAITGNTYPEYVSNVVPRIVREVIKDNGGGSAGRFKFYDIEADFKGRHIECQLSAEEFMSVEKWLERCFPAGCQLEDVPTADKAVRNAMRSLSGEIPLSTVYTHSGWLKVDGKNLYLFNGGAIGENGLVSGIETEMGDRWKPLAFPEPAWGEELHKAIRASLSLLDLGPDIVTVPAFGATYRAPMGWCDTSLHIEGPTGGHKTGLAVLMQQHFGAGFATGERTPRPPASFADTANKIERVAFSGKDALCLVDEFKPGEGSKRKGDEMQAAYETVFRNKSNRTNRGRLTDSISERQDYPARALLVATGEDLPAGHSMRARLYIVHIDEGAIAEPKLTALQGAAADGVLAQAMAGFLKWLAPQYDGVAGALQKRTKEIGTELKAAALHRRTPGAVADLLSGCEWFLRFAKESGAITAAQALAYRRRCRDALIAGADDQAREQETEKPEVRYFERLKEAIAAGKCHIKGIGGGAPPKPEACGYQLTHTISGKFVDGEPTKGSNTIEEWRPLGACIGYWADGGIHVFINPGEAYKVVGHDIGVGLKTLSKRLGESGSLMIDDREARKMWTVRRTCAGLGLEVLVVSPDRLGLLG
jgi:hypothetical protein